MRQETAHTGLRDYTLLMRRLVVRLLPALGLLCAALWFLAGITWGLPSRRADGYLFGDASKAWTGKQIIELAGGWEEDASRGADVDEVERLAECVEDP